MNAADPLPYRSGAWRSSVPFEIDHGPVTGTASTVMGWTERAVYDPRWYTDDDYADQLLIEHRRGTTGVTS